MSEFVPIRNPCHVHLVDHPTRVGCSAFCCAPHRADESQLAQNSCPRLRFSVWSLSCRCRVKFSTQSDQPCRNLSHLYFWLIRSFTDPVYTCSIFVCGPLLIVYWKRRIHSNGKKFSAVPFRWEKRSTSEDTP